MIYHFILNPKSGRPRNLRNAEDIIKAACRKRKLSYHIYYTTCPGDATEYVRSMVRISDSRQRFICVGGDGTFSEVVNSAPSNLNVEFGVIPYGSGNDFVRCFDNRSLFYDINAQIDGETVTLDLLRYNNAYSVNMINIGFDCAVAHTASKFRRRNFLPPSFAYTFGVIKTFFKKIGTPMKIIFDDGEIWDGVFTLTAIGNGKYCGGGYKATPEASLTDGLVDICAIKKISRFTLIRLISSYRKGTHLNNPKAKPYIMYKKASHFKMEFTSPLPICIDGEIKGAKNIEFSAVPQAFNFVIPKTDSVN